MRRGVVLSQGLTRLTALTRNLHLRENIFPFYENIAQFCHKNSMGYVIVAWMDLATMSWVLSEGRHLCAWPISPSPVCTKYSMKQQRWSVHNVRSASLTILFTTNVLTCVKPLANSTQHLKLNHTPWSTRNVGVDCIFVIVDKNNDFIWNSELNKTVKTQYYSKYFLYFFWIISVGRIHL